LIIFGNIYTNKDGLPRFNIIALYERGQLQHLDKERKIELFPNTGNVFVPYDPQLPDRVKYGLFEVSESYSYDPDKVTSLKYSLGMGIARIPLYEVIQIMELAQDDHLIERLRRGFRLAHEPLPNVLIHTSDDYLIGPLQLKKRNNEEVWDIQDDSSPYRQNCFDLFRYENTYLNEPERFFVVADLTKEPVVGDIDLASNERVIRDILRMIRENADLGDLTRKIIRQLGEWGNTGYISDELVQRRLQRTIRILSVHTLDQALIDEVQQTLFELPYVQTYVNQQLDEYRIGFRKQLEEEHLKLSRQINSLRAETERSGKELDTIRMERDKLEQTLFQLQEKSEAKIAEIQTNVIGEFINQLAWRGLGFAETSSALAAPERTSAEPTMYAISLERQAPIYDKLEDYWAYLEPNLRMPESRLIAQTLLCAATTDVPVLIVGKRSLELAQLLAHYTTASETITVLPEIHTFSLEGLTKKFQMFRKAQAVKSLLLHNAHLTSAEFSLPSFLKLRRWSQGSIAPDLVFLSIDDQEAAEAFMDKFRLSPVLNADQLIRKVADRRVVPPEECGQIMLSMLDELKIDDTEDERVAFEEWLLETHSMELGPIPRQFDVWLAYLRISGDAPLHRYQWMWQIFERYWQHVNARSEPK